MPSLGIGFLKTGERSTQVFSDIIGAQSITFKDLYNYLTLSLGAKIKVRSLYVLPEIGIGINLSNKLRRIIRFSDGDVERETFDGALIFGSFNRITVPVAVTIGKEFSVGSQVLAAGIRSYYGLNRVIRDLPRNGHYFGIGLNLGIAL